MTARLRRSPDRGLGGEFHGGRPVPPRRERVRSAGAAPGASDPGTEVDTWASSVNGHDRGAPTPGSAADAQIAELVRQLSFDESMDRRTRSKLLGRLAKAVSASARKAGVTSLAGGQWLAESLAAIAAHLPVRSREMLRAHHHGLRGDSLAESLAEAATRSTTGVGAAGGALAAVEYAAPSTLLYAPAQIAAETLAVAAIEVKLVAELHEVYGVQVPGSGSARAATFVHAWARRRGFDPASPGSLTRALGPATRNELRRRMMFRASRNVTTLGPLFTGAVAGAVLNRHATRKLADAVRDDLRRRAGREDPAHA